MKLDDFLHDLKLLANNPIIQVQNIKDVVNSLKTEEVKKYLELLVKSKPETLISDYIIDPVLKELGISANPQTSIKKGKTTEWVDYEIISRTHNPVGLEVKMMYSLSYNKKEVRIQPLKEKFEKLKKEFEKNRTNQIIKYLRKYAYVFFTNGVDVMIFNRDAVVDFEPFETITFIDLVSELKRSKDLYEFAQKREDTKLGGKKDLDEQFFKDLKEWYKSLGEIKWKGKEALIEKAKISLLDKIIFAQTLEDYSLIPFKFLSSKFENAEKDWSPKGKKKLLEKFFESIDEWFYDYYDTELFKTNILEYIEDSPKNYDKFYELLKWIMGFGDWQKTFRKGIASYNYRYIDEDVFGKSYEMFLAENRKEEGIYYTPKFITNYMSHLLIQAECEKEKNRLLEICSTSISDEDFEEAKRLAKSLISKTFVDISMGSGSFLIKVLREMFKVYKKIDEETKWAGIEGWIDEPDDIRIRRERILEIRKIMGFTSDKLDLNIKQKLITTIVLRHIYGIDLDYGAIEVGKANLWKEAVKLSPEEFRFEELQKSNDHVLPNLSANFIHGNSIISLLDEVIIEKIESNDEVKKKIAQIIKLRNQYLADTSNPEPVNEILKKKQEIKEEIKKQKEIKDMLPEDNMLPLLYPVEFPHLYFDEKGNALPKERRGFDGVIGNPPYVQLQKFKGQPIQEIYKKQGYESYDANGDLYCLFYEKGLSLLKQKGHLCYITSNKWMRANYGKKLREYFSKYNPKLIIDLGPNVFKDATNDTNILLIQKEKNNNKLKGIAITEQNFDKLDKLTETDFVSIPNFGDSPWIIVNDKTLKLKEKIEKIGAPLKDWDINIYFGIKTGYNKAFIITTEKRNEILANCKTEEERKRTEEIIKPILRGRDIGRYYYKWAGLWVIGTFPALHLNIEDYPAIKKYFLDNFDIRQLEQAGKKYPDLGFNSRKKTGNKWFETQDSIAYYPEFEKEKIVWQEIVREPSFSYDNEKLYCEATTFLMTGSNLKYLLSILNSKPASFFFKKFYAGGGLGEEGYRYKKAFLERLPIPKIPESKQKPFVELVDKILAITQKEDYDPKADNEDNRKVKEYERQIDELVYKLYSLTPEEIKIVKNPRGH